MKGLTFLTAAAALLPALGATSRPSQPARDLPPTYACERATGAIAVDGALDDPAWAGARETEDFIDITGSAGKPPPALRTRAKMLWDDQHLYVAVSVAEPRVAATTRQRDEQLFREQCVELFLDPGGDGKDYLELQVNPLNTICDLSMNKPYRDKGKANVAFGVEGLRSAVRVNGTMNDPSDTDAGWTVELAIPWAALKALRDGLSTRPHAGERWRANLARTRPQDAPQDGAGKSRRDMWVWASQGAVNMHLPERWGWLEFAARPDPVERATSSPATGHE